MQTPSEQEIKRHGATMFELMQGQKPSVFKKDWWSGKMMDLSMQDEAFKVEMFRFVDVFPTLRDPVQVAVHLQEYFCRPEQDFPASFQWGLNKVKPEGMIARVASGQIEKQIMGMAAKFIAGKDAKEALPTLKKMWKQGLAFTLDLLGESTVSEKEAREYFERYDEILDTLIAEVKDFPEQPSLENSPYGKVPRVNVSIKISSLFSQIDPIDTQGSIDALKERLRPLYRKAMQAGAFINMDMEHYAYKDLTIALFKSLLSEPEFVAYPHVGMVIQAYLRDAEADAKALCEWVKAHREAPVTVRLVKGAYWDYETIHSEQEGWPIPVFLKKWETDASYERCTRVLLSHHEHIRTAIASHNVRSIAHAMAFAEAQGLDKQAFELQMLYGMAEPMKSAAQKMGYRVRDYVPIGELVPGMAYLVRRLLENTSNESWLRASYADGKSVDELLSAPAGEPSSPEPRIEHFTAHGFRNEPLRDFSRSSVREAFQAAMDAVKGSLGQAFAPVVNNKALTYERSIKSLNPSDTSVIVGEVGVSTVEQAEAALDAARAVQSRWARLGAKPRAGLLFKLADLMRARRDELSSWMVFEVGKTWREADADVCEAIDFCDFYAREMLRLGRPMRLGRVPGELGQLFHRPRGVAVVIAPWNFPLAILCGMTMAAAVTGNTVIMKPAEQSSVIAAKLMELVLEAGFPPGVVNFLPGFGEDVGAHLVQSPKSQLVAFTGSMQVGLQILATAGVTHPMQPEVKKVICEMGGKNAIIVDADADLDEAVHGIIHSAFGFQGQKCSACSRVIVHESAYEALKERLVEATRSIMIGPAHDPTYAMGPVIDAQSKKRIEHYIELGQQEGAKLLIAREAPEGGFYVGPVIFDEVSPDSRLAQEEIFGPVLAMMQARSFDHALEMANSTRFALTGAVYSRSPINIQKAYEGFDVGNLYINRGSTGALVYRQPFGGYKLSGVGTKAGGPDYLQHFMVPRVVSENTMRRGFAPED